MNRRWTEWVGELTRAATIPELMDVLQRGIHKLLPGDKVRCLLVVPETVKETLERVENGTRDPRFVAYPSEFKCDCIAPGSQVFGFTACTQEPEDEGKLCLSLPLTARGTWVGQWIIQDLPEDFFAAPDNQDGFQTVASVLAVILFHRVRIEELENQYRYAEFLHRCLVPTDVPAPSFGDTGTPQVLVYFQPIVSVPGCEPMGYEVLARLRDDIGTIHTAGRFMAVAQRMGLMPFLDRHILRQSLEVLHHYHQAGQPIQLAVNLSAQTLENPATLQAIEEQIVSSGLPGEALILEVSERATQQQIRYGFDFMQRLQLRGIRFALDDFGVGMSTVGHVRMLPIEFIKIDTSLTRGVEQEKNRLLMSSITEFARVLQVRTIAEGVETEAAFEALQRIGVDFAQGFFLAPPRQSIEGHGFRPIAPSAASHSPQQS